MRNLKIKVLLYLLLFLGYDCKFLVNYQNHSPFISMFPHMVDAAFASSAPIWVDHNAYRYWSNIGLQLKNRIVGGSLSCYNAVKLGFQELDRRLSDPSTHWADLADGFRFCPRYRILSNNCPIICFINCFFSPKS